jgi:hypothetical protein
MKALMEPLLNEHGVDLVISGPVHAYERTFPVNAGRRDPCGPVYVSLGDAGNYEAASAEWGPAEDWSAFRESTFGIGHIDFHNETHASFEWGKLACESHSTEYHFSFRPNCRSAGVAPNAVNGGGVTRSDRATLKSWQARCPQAFATRRPRMADRFKQETDELSSLSKEPEIEEAALEADVEGLWSKGAVDPARGAGTSHWWMHAAFSVALIGMGAYVVLLRKELRDLQVQQYSTAEFPNGAE